MKTKFELGDLVMFVGNRGYRAANPYAGPPSGLLNRKGIVVSIGKEIFDSYYGEERGTCLVYWNDGSTYSYWFDDLKGVYVKEKCII